MHSPAKSRIFPPRAETKVFFLLSVQNSVPTSLTSGCRSLVAVRKIGSPSLAGIDVPAALFMVKNNIVIRERKQEL
jgi:hypothetical protein